MMNQLGPGDPGYSSPLRYKSANRGLERAIVQLGGIVYLARRLGVTPGAVQKWSRLGRIPAERVLDIERATGGEVTRHQLRPDLYP